MGGGGGGEGDSAGANILYGYNKYNSLLQTLELAIKINGFYTVQGNTR